MKKIIAIVTMTIQTNITIVQTIWNVKNVRIIIQIWITNLNNNTIDEIITSERDNAEFSKANGYDKSADYHNKIAEWLEELKAYRENSNGYNKEDIELNRNAMYNKAIDDFVNAIVDRGQFTNQ